jgi:hypothetical protein
MESGDVTQGNGEIKSRECIDWIQSSARITFCDQALIVRSDFCEISCAQNSEILVRLRLIEDISKTIEMEKKLKQRRLGCRWNDSGNRTIAII